MKRQRTHHKFRKVAMRNLAEFSGGSAIRYFTLTRRKNEVGEPSGVTVALALPSAVRAKLTVKPSDENAGYFFQRG